MKNTMLKWSLPGLIALSLAACGGTSSHFGEGLTSSAAFTSGDTSSDTNNPDDNTHNNAPTININVYNGSWVTSPQCIYNSQTGQGIRSFWDFQNGNGVLNSNIYSTSDCSGNYNSQQLAYNFSYGNTLPNVSSICANVVEVDLVLVSATRNGQPVAISQLDSSIQTRQYNLLCADNNHLYFGDTRSDNHHNGSSLRNRPLSLDQDSPFLRF
jgi:hypothetical protein